MHGDDNGRAGRQSGEIGGEPPELRGVDTAFVGAVICDADGVEDDEVVALVVEGVIGLAEVIFVEFFAVEGSVGATPLAG
ncbi:MAG TPA: hypothetical protein VNY78_04630 [Edaphobacter sp.]|nr:hypothetical protein [Edaphobacter sp.]